MAEEPGETDIWDSLLDLMRRVRETGNLAKWWATNIDELLLKKGLIVDDETRKRLTDAVDRAFVQAPSSCRG